LHTAEGNAQMGPGYGMGPGMMGGQGGNNTYGGQQMGPGTMGGQGGNNTYGGQQMGPGYGNSSQYRQSQKPLDEKGAQKIAENYLQSVQNPNLKLGKIKDTGQVFVVEIVTKKSADLVSKLSIDKNTGRMSPVN
ncbi:MAG: hypothetical protein WB792_00405, partial [Desulfobacterales bacterium]